MKRLIVVIVCGCSVVALPAMALGWRIRPVPAAHDLVPGNPALFASAAAATSPCSAATLRGSYGIAWKGTSDVMGTGAAAGIITFDGAGGAALSRFLFDGNGAITGSGAASLAGSAVLRTFTGTYSIRPDCSGSVTITSDLGGTITLGVVLLDQGNAGYFVGITPGMTLNGATTRVAG